ncbi:ABC-type transport auxiliary lipoprotein family protein [Marinobacter sp. CHS3-4]|uniref:ABC-type transport auxiliary lipoprotein family protein n=1 Tax=Marinobacter sp. CHS3-4 TaxID=3045174 RepID=UPI0024B5A34A|nr:ABC-type transport auxiliary lipoprotein family protein [Marinobacter sp. CHS3-4]MDI9245284.1 ABC-type transport auxiliary lipoprotein family protein [Marinobacter sp. CHS3-4]
MTFYNGVFSAVLLILVLSVSGCTVLPERTAKQTFLLASPDFEASPDPLPFTLRVLTPDTEAPLNGTSILVRRDNHTIQSYRGARWAKAMPLLIRDYWLGALRQAGAFQAVIHDTSDANSHLSLISDLTAFQLEYHDGQEPGPTVVITVDAQLTESKSGDVLAARRFNVQERAQAKPVEDLVVRFSAANRALADELVQWAEAVSRDAFQETDQAKPL